MIDIAFFGSGAGLVLLGYLCGIVVGAVLRALSLSKDF